MQLISCSPGLRIDIRAEKPNYTAQGYLADPTRALFVQFEPGGNVPDYAKAEVERLPGFRMGIGRDEDPYLTRLGWFDTVAAQAQYGWSDEDRAYVEARLEQIADPNVIVLEQQKVDSPYGNYDKHRKTQGKRTLDHVFADLRNAYETAGFDVEQAVAYERQNGGDERVAEFLSTLGADVPAEVEEVVAA